MNDMENEMDNLIISGPPILSTADLRELWYAQGNHGHSPSYLRLCRVGCGIVLDSQAMHRCTTTTDAVEKDGDA